MSKKEELSWTLTGLCYIILSETSNYFLTMTTKEEAKWEIDFTKNNMNKYTMAELETAIDKARVFCKEQGFIK